MQTLLIFKRVQFRSADDFCNPEFSGYAWIQVSRLIRLGSSNLLQKHKVCSLDTFVPLQEKA
jgi:hypothetical protein